LAGAKSKRYIKVDEQHVDAHTQRVRDNATFIILTHFAGLFRITKKRPLNTVGQHYNI